MDKLTAELTDSSVPSKFHVIEDDPESPADCTCRHAPLWSFMNRVNRELGLRQGVSPSAWSAMQR